MIMTDPIADFLARIRNANMIKHETLEILASKIKRDIAEILKREGSIRNIEYIKDDKQGVTRVFLKYGKNEERVITNLRCISKPGLHAYIRVDEVPKVLNDLGTAIVSTSEGVVTGKEAKAKDIDDEVIAYVW